MHNKRRITIFLFIATIGFLGFKLNIQSTQLGQYRGEGYNFFNPLGEWSIERQYLVPNIPDQLRQAYAAQGVNLNTVVFDNAVIKIWGPTLDAAPADRIYNVVFHPDVQRWRNSNNDFNTNLLVGLFDPKGVAAVGAEGISFNTFGQINVNKHDQIYYSPNNGRFQIEAGRKIVAFWTAALSEDKSKTVIQFNIIIDDQAWSDLIRDYVIMESEGLIDQAQIILANFAQQLNTPADRQTFNEGMALIKRLEGKQEEPAQQEQASSSPSEKPFERVGNQPFQMGVVAAGRFVNGRPVLNLDSEDSLVKETYRNILKENGKLVVALVFLNDRNQNNWQIYDAASFITYLQSRRFPYIALTDPVTQLPLDLNNVEYYVLNSPTDAAFTLIGNARDAQATNRAIQLAQLSASAPSSQQTEQEQAERAARKQAAALRAAQLKAQQDRVREREVAEAVERINKGISSLRDETHRLLELRLERGERQEIAAAEMRLLQNAGQRFAEQAEATAAQERLRREQEQARQQEQQRAAEQARQQAEQERRAREEAERARREAEILRAAQEKLMREQQEQTRQQAEAARQAEQQRATELARQQAEQERRQAEQVQQPLRTQEEEREEAELLDEIYATFGDRRK
jgi:hypothetical protein